MIHELSELATAMLERVLTHDHVSMIELMHVCRERGVDPTGDLMLFLYGEDGEYANLAFWAGVNETFANALDEIRPHTELVATVPMLYLIDGGMLTLPVAKRPTKRGYKKPHWVPVVVRPLVAA